MIMIFQQVIFVIFIDLLEQRKDEDYDEVVEEALLDEVHILYTLVYYLSTCIAWHRLICW